MTNDNGNRLLLTGINKRLHVEAHAEAIFDFVVCTKTMTTLSQAKKITVVVPKTDANPSPIVHTATVSAPTNIACIKYWGKVRA